MKILFTFEKSKNVWLLDRIFWSFQDEFETENTKSQNFDKTFRGNDKSKDGFISLDKSKDGFISFSLFCY